METGRITKTRHNKKGLECDYTNEDLASLNQPKLQSCSLGNRIFASERPDSTSAKDYQHGVPIGSFFPKENSTSAKDYQHSESCTYRKFFPKGEASSDNSRTAIKTTTTTNESMQRLDVGYRHRIQALEKGPGKGSQPYILHTH